MDEFLVEYIPKDSLEKKIVPECTRFPKQVVPFRSGGFGLVSTVQDTDGSTTDASTDLDAVPLPLEEERQAREQARRQEQETYVNMTPLLVPGAGNESPIVTWGTVASTPLVLSGQEQGTSDDPDEKIAKIASFAVAEESDRERAAQKAQEQLERRARKAKSEKTKRRKRSSNRWSREDSLTPAALSLLEKTKASSSKQRDTFASLLRSSYTPQRQRSSSSSRPRSDNAFKATPLTSRYQPQTAKSRNI